MIGDWVLHIHSCWKQIHYLTQRVQENQTFILGDIRRYSSCQTKKCSILFQQIRRVMKLIKTLILVLILPVAGIFGQSFQISESSINETINSGDQMEVTLNIENLSSEVIVVAVQAEIGGINIEPVTFTKQDDADWTLAENQDRITDNVWITRQSSEGIYNIQEEESFSSDSPADTEWSYGATRTLSPEDYMVWREAIDADPPGMVGKTISMHLISDDIYFDVDFESWSCCGAGGFSYTRTLANVWLEFDETIELKGNTSGTITIVLDASFLSVGEYSADVTLSEGDTEVVVPVTLNVTDAPGLSLPTEAIDFGEVFISGTSTYVLEVTNSGTQDLILSSISSADPQVTTDVTSLGIDPGEGDEIIIYYTPTELGVFATTVTLETNDPTDQNVELTIAGEAVEPPVIGVSTSSMEVAINSGESSGETFVIGNSGESNLEFNISGFATGDDIAWNPTSTEDPNEEFELDIKNIYTAYTAVEILFRYEFYQKITEENDYTESVVIAIDSDNSGETGYVLSDFGHTMGMDYAIGDNGDGLQLLRVIDSEDLELEPVMDIATFEYEIGEDELIVGIPNDVIEFGSSFEFVAFIDDDVAPNSGMDAYSFTRLPSWLSISPLDGSVSVDNESEIGVVFDATNLNDGTYSATIEVSSNDPVNEVSEIDVTLTVTGVPVYAGPGDINFGEIFVNQEVSEEITISNIGTKTILVSDVASNGDNLSFPDENIEILPGEEAYLVVTFSASATGEFEETLSFSTTDPDNSNVTILFSAEVVEAPEINASAGASYEVLVGESTTVNYTFHNEGGSDLHFEIPDYAEYSLNLNQFESYALIPDNESLEPEDGITISMWLYLQSNPDIDSENNFRFILQKSFSNSSGSGYDIILEENNSITWSAGTEQGNFRYGGGELILGVWNHLMTTYDGNSGVAKVYINGSEINGDLDGAGGGSINGNFFEVLISNYSSEGFERNFPGQIYNLKMWDHAKSAAEVEAEMLENLTGEEDGLILNIDFTDVENSNTYIDKSPNHNDAVAEGVERSETSPFSWLSFSNREGSIAPDGSHDLNITFLDVEKGTRNARITIATNDPTQPFISVPITASFVVPTDVKQDISVPNLFNYPNPFHAKTNIPIHLDNSIEVRLQIWNIYGQLVYENTRKLSQGSNELQWNANEFPDGQYLYRVSTARGILGKGRMVLKR